MPKPNSALQGRPVLAGFLDVAAMDLPREARLRAWMRRNGITFTQVAGWWDCHFSLPGKILVAEVEPLNDERRADLIQRGFPEDILPEPWSREKRLASNQALHQHRKEYRKEKRISGFLAERAERGRQ